MGILKIEFNIFNIIICSFIFGLGVDYSIFITNALFTEYRTGERTLPTHKTSIILSVITTIAGVGVMIFAKHPVLYTISLVSIIGILCAAFVSFTVQPLLFKLFIGSHKKRPISPRYLIHSLLSFGYFGGGGFLGRYISQQLLTRGARVGIAGYEHSTSASSVQGGIGQVSSLIGPGGHELNLQISAPMIPVRPGGPILNGQGQLAGIAGATQDTANGRRSTYLGVSGEIAKLFLAQNGIRPQIAPGKGALGDQALTNHARSLAIMLSCKDQ